MLSQEERAELIEILKQTEKKTTRSLRENRNINFAINFSSYAQSEVDQIKDSVVKSGAKFDCRKGCSYCCTLRVESYPQETFRIARKMRERDDVQSLIDTLGQYSQKVTGLRMEEHYEPCPFLVKNECSIYDVRPFMCRKYNSLDVEKCKDPNAVVPENGELAYKAGSISLGTSKGYERNKLNCTPHELGQGVLLALTDPTAEQRWFNGEPVFVPLPEMEDKR